MTAESSGPQTSLVLLHFDQVRIFKPHLRPHLNKNLDKLDFKFSNLTHKVNEYDQKRSYFITSQNQ